MTTISSVIRTHAAERPDAVALVCGAQSLTWAELHARSNRVADALRRVGVGFGDRVAFLDKNGLEYFELLFATAKLGAVLVAVNFRLTAREVGFIVNDAEARVFVVGAEFLPLAAELAGALETVHTLLVIGGDAAQPSYAAWRDGGADVDPDVTIRGSDVAFQFYSSGTTGDPKGVLLSHDNVFGLLPTSSQKWGVDAGSVNLIALPLFHVGGGGWAMVGMFHGCKSVVVRDVDPTGLIRVIGEHRISHAFLVPVLLHFMQQVPAAATGDFSSLELIVYGASPISESVLAGAVRRMGCKFAQAYGLTETTGAIVTLPPEDHDPQGPHRHRLRAAGKPHDGVELKIVAPDSGAEMPVGVPGEIWTRSQQNMVGYWRNAEGTAAAINVDGWLRTGDIGYFDDDGYVYIHDRVKDMIISGGENIYPAEVENILMKHPAVADAAVIGVPSDVWGESPFAVVVARPGATVDPQELQAFARQHLAKFKVPVGVSVVAALPRTPTGKLLKRELRAPFWHGRERAVS
ncbi:long-chain-fatty-acid--CoA ligase [Nannocystis bainbridge]|uniref:Long-chain-fatty-acid--CoA ligase n=1 Tax=Nannocystis bainbridge TaxID=2995303 RepID=A0ABT5E7T1_9BACT|nr:long-chain-fatty-acid--CoA ligase [Nannocystis bainbridge]MDC0721483.1 long-chain-fatty-acid--CoA ligase [Nannocystis bainbridge]